MAPEDETRRLYRELLQPAGKAAGPERPARQGEAPLVGRDGSLAQLRVAFAAVCEGRPGLVLVEGEAGVGKTRLIAEFCADAVGRVLQGYAFENERTLPFAVWADALRRAGAPADAALLAVLRPGWRAELARVFPEIAQSGEPPPAPNDPARLFAAFTELLRVIADRPTVLVLEDLHWADELSVRLLSFAARRLNDRPIVVVATVRAEELTEASVLRRAFAELERERRLERLPLAPLSEAESAALVLALAPPGGLPGPTTAWTGALWPMSQGNPFVIVEAMRALREGGSLGASDAPTLPDPVRRLIAERIERLSGPAQEALALAAAIGRDFEFALLARALGDASRAADAVEELVQRRLLHSVDDGAFDFTHERTRKVAYARLLAPRRVLLHRAIAEALEGLYAPDLGRHYGALAHHFELGENWDEAVRYLRAAATQAAARSAYREAATRVEQALTLVAQRPVEGAPELAVDLRLDLRNALMVLGEFERILSRLGEAAELARAAGDDARLARVGCSMVHVLRVAGRYEEAIEAGREALALSRGDPVIEVQARFYMGSRALRPGRLRRRLRRAGALHRAVRRARARLLRSPVPSGDDLPAVARLVSGRTWPLRRGGRQGEGIQAVAECSGDRPERAGRADRARLRVCAPLRLRARHPLPGASSRRGAACPRHDHPSLGGGAARRRLRRGRPDR